MLSRLRYYIAMRFPIAPPIFGLLAAAAVVVNSAEDVGTTPAAAVVDSRVCSADDNGGSCASPPDDPKEADVIISAAHTPTPTCNDSDEDDKCADYAANENACTDNPGYMTYKCAATCNTCAGPSVENAVVSAFATTSANGSGEQQCGDDNYQCSEWAGRGECDANPK